MKYNATFNLSGTITDNNKFVFAGYVKDSNGLEIEYKDQKALFVIQEAFEELYAHYVDEIQSRKAIKERIAALEAELQELYKELHHKNCS